MEAIKNLIVDGVEYPVDQFSPQVQNLVATRQKWSDELLNERSAVVKTEAAIRQLDNELSTLVQQELSKDKEQTVDVADIAA